MEDDQKPAQELNVIMKQAHGAMENYFRLLQKSVSGFPWGDNLDRTYLTNEIMSFAERNIAAAFEFAHKLSQAKNSEELVRIQTEFVRAQLKFLGDEVRDLSEASSKTTAGAGKTPFFKTALD